MTSTYYVKVYYTKQQYQQPEIRRFAIDISPENNVYEELCTKIATYQPEIQLHGFTLQYIDEENERITFSSNEELRSAVASVKGSNTLKIFVTSNQQQQQQNTANKEPHVGVECDGCNGPVVGFRYKCVVCSNYDLCEKCSSAGVHSEHDMIKITKPSNSYHPYESRHHGRRHHRHPSPPLPPPLFPLPPPFTSNPHFFEHIQAQIPHWLPNRENTAHFRENMRQHIDTIKTNTQSHIQNSKQYLENVGQYLQQTLSPMGINCDYRVDTSTNDQQQTTTASNEESNQPEPSAVPKNSDETSNNMNTDDNNGNNRGISSWLNMLRTNGEDSSTTATNQNSKEGEKVVEECVEKMKAMGFGDPDPELIELIRSKNGDLNSVLDEMVRYHQP